MKPPYTYAQTCIHIGELYAAVLYKFGHWTLSGMAIVTVGAGQLAARTVEGLTSLAKRFLAKAIDILNREQEQNRNTFHLMSEAWFNLGDILMIRLLSVTGGKSGVNGELWNGDYAKRISVDLKSDNGESRSDSADRCPEDLRRQVSEAYRQGLRYVQHEMSDFRSRFRVPADVYYANRNIMDPVLHFRICRAVRLRHAGCWKGTVGKNAKALREQFDKVLRDISEYLSNYESPQAYETEGDSRDAAPSNAWSRSMLDLIKLSNQVRTDRGPLAVNGNEVSWREETKLFASEGGPFVFYATRE